MSYARENRDHRTTSDQRQRGRGAPTLFELTALESRLLMAGHVHHSAAWIRHHTPEWTYRHTPTFIRHHYDLDASPALDVTPTLTPAQGSLPLSSVPVLNSKSGAPVTLYLDFNGDSSSSWSFYSPTPTPAYDQDGDPTTFSSGEITSIQQIWARVAEKYSPFNINVTTVDPGTLADRVSYKVIIGGNGSWYGQTTGGVTYVGSFTNSMPNVSYVFSNNLGNDPNYTGDCAAHEAGHAFGLQHQSTYDGSGAKTAEYNPGTSLAAPIMGVSYSAQRGLWWNGTSTSLTTFQDDLAVISSSTNGFGYRTDDYGNTAGTASALTFSGSTATASGIIEKTSDQDWFSFTTTGGTVSFTGGVAPYGAMLDMRLELRNSSGTVVAAADTSSLGESINTTVAAGTYCVVVASHGSYGDIGQYSLSGTVTQAAPQPPVANAGGPYNVNEGGSVTLSGTGSTGTGLTYAWDLDGDGIYGETGSAATRGNETGAAPIFLASGLDGPTSRTVSLRVTDSAGNTNTSSATVNVLDVAPTVTITGAASVRVGSTYTLTLSASDPGPDLITSWLINWGDGTTSTVDLTAGGAAGTMAPVTATHTFTSGSWSITASATDDAGAFPSNTVQVSASNAKPTGRLLRVDKINSSLTAAASLVVTYSGDDSLDASTFDGNDILVTGPNGYSRSATFVSAVPNSDGTSYTVTYAIPPSGGSTWTRTDNGTYALSLRAASVADAEGNAVDGASLGTLSVAVPAPDYAGNTRTAARYLGYLTIGKVKVARDTVEPVDTQDWYRFRLKSKTALSIKLSELTADANLQLRAGDNTLLKTSGNAGTHYELITKTLNAGTYYIRVYPVGSVSTDYALRISPTAPPTTSSTATKSAPAAAGPLPVARPSVFSTITMIGPQLVTLTDAGQSILN